MIKDVYLRLSSHAVETALRLSRGELDSAAPKAGTLPTRYSQVPGTFYAIHNIILAGQT